MISDFEMSRMVLGQILLNPSYANKIIPHVNEGMFVDTTERAIANSIVEFNQQYNRIPNTRELIIEMKELPDVANLDKNVVNEVFQQPANVVDDKWLENQTERFIRRRRVSLAFEKTYTAFEEGGQVDDFAQIFQEAVAFTFDDSVGMSFVNDAQGRWELYTADEMRCPFFLKMFNKTTSGGMPGGTLNVILAGTGVGKSLFMCSEAAGQAMSGKKVLYISLEMAELRIAERLESNLMDVPLSSMKDMKREDFYLRQQQYIKKMKEAGGDIIFKQYPTGAAGANHFRNLLIECKNKLGYEFDVIYVDYLNICMPMRGNSTDNSYTRVKTVAEELRALGIIFNVPIVSATQTNKGGQNATSLSLEDVSESHGLSVTVDLMFAMISTPEWEEQGKIMFQQLKNRYGPLTYYNKFMIGLDRAKMRLYDVSEEAHASVNKGTNPANNALPAPAADAFAGLDLSVLGFKPKTGDLSTLKT